VRVKSAGGTLGTIIGLDFYSAAIARVDIGPFTGSPPVSVTSVSPQ
jgi:hypothetical protein